mmetsp:Transcript_15037/g.30424  ORF Transcript_15037/g.30424 Transcript_15037/m.30424 type:complete len:220 (-) Transcript_15037:699-1358(-)
MGRGQGHGGGSGRMLNRRSGRGTREEGSSVQVRSRICSVDLHRIPRSAPVTLCLNSEVVLSQSESEPAILPPPGAPGIPHNPELRPVLLRNAPPRHFNPVVSGLDATGISEDPPCIVRLQLGGRRQTANDGSSSLDFFFHFRHPFNCPILLYGVLCVGVGDRAFVVVVAGEALRGLPTVIAFLQALCSVHVAGLVRQASVQLDELQRAKSVTTSTTLLA